MKFFVIGNGFDLNHGLPSRLRDFGTYLEEKDKHLHTWFLLKFNCHSFDIENSDWNELESYLSKYDFEQSFEEALACRERFSQSENDKFWWSWQQSLINEKNNFEHLKDHLDDWVNGLNNRVKSLTKKSYPFNKADYFLTFNYTETLEILYKVDSSRVLHIHGDNKKGNKVLGHNEPFTFNEKPFEDLDFQWVADEANRLYDFIGHYFDKKSDELIKKNRAFFQRISLADELIIIGWSRTPLDFGTIIA